jgi:O-antigen/teichoic acid export membrane protein
MGIVQKEALNTTILSYIGLIIGYINKGFLFIVFLSTEQIGLVNLLLAVGLLFAHLSNFGLVNAVWRFFPFFRNEEKDHYGFLKGILIKVILGACIYAIVAYILKPEIIYLYKEKSALFVDYFFWVIPIGLANVMFLIFDMFLRGLNKNTISVISNEFFHRILTTVLILLFAFKLIHFDLFVVLFSLSFFLPTLILFVHLVKIKELKFKKSTAKISKKFQRIVYSYSIFSYLNSIGSVVVVTMDAMMIAVFLGLKATGVYSTILYLINALQIPIRSILRVGTSLVAKYWKEKDMEKMNELYIKVSSISLIISLYTFMLVWINIDHIIFYLPKDFKIAGITFLIFMIGKMIDMYFGLNGIIFITSKKYKYDIIFTTILLVAVYFMNLFLIPRFNILGAAISTSFAIIFYNLGRLIFVWKFYRLQPFELNQFKIIGLFGIVLVMFEILPVYDIHPIIYSILNSIIITILFIGGIILFKFNQDLNGYINKVTFKLLKKEFISK